MHTITYYLPVQLNLATVWLTKYVSKIHSGSWSELVTSSNNRLSLWWRNTTYDDRGLQRCEVTVWVDTSLLAAIEQLTQHSVRLSSRRFLFDTLFSNGQLGHQLGIPSPLPPRHHRCPLFLTVLSDQRFDFLRENYLATTVFCNFSISQKIITIFFYL